MSEPYPPSTPSAPFSPQPSTEPRRQAAGTAVMEPERVLQEAEPGDHERFAHYVKKDKVVESAVTGQALTALCGKVWVPSRDPKRFPVCPTCKEIYDGLRPGPEDGKGSDGSGGSGSGGSGSD